MVLLVAPTISGSNQLALNFFLFMLLGVGLTQLLYVGPAILYFQGRRRSEVVKGLLLGALLTILLNGGCFILPGMAQLVGLGSTQIQFFIALLVGLVILVAIGLYCLKARSDSPRN
jgi:hypothetical protein